VLSIIFLLRLPLVSYPASIGEVETQGQGRFSIGINQEFLFNRNLKFDKANHDIVGIVIGKLRMDELNETIIKISYGLFDNFDVYAESGIADFKTKINYSGTNNGEGIYDGDSGFTYGLGIKGTRQFENNWLVGADLRYLRQTNDWSIGGDFQGEGGKATIQEWHLAPYIGYKIENLIPYFGIKYSGLKIKTEWAGVDKGKYEKYSAADNVGVFFGADYKLTESWALNLEGRFVDETAMSFGTIYKF